MEKEKQIRIPASLHRELKKIAKKEGKHLERVSQEIIETGLKTKQQKALPLNIQSRENANSKRNFR